MLIPTIPSSSECAATGGDHEVESRIGLTDIQKGFKYRYHLSICRHCLAYFTEVECLDPSRNDKVVFKQSYTQMVGRKSLPKPPPMIFPPWMQ